MTIFPVLVFLLLVGLFVATGVSLYRSIRSHRRTRSALLLVPFLLLTFYFAQFAVGQFQRSPAKIFRYALGFAPPSGCTELVGHEEQGFHPGATMWLRFRASPEALTSIISQAHFSPRTAREFSDLQKQEAPKDWWTPPTQASFWLSSDFHGPYSFHDAGLAYDTNSQTTFIYVTGFD